MSEVTCAKIRLKPGSVPRVHAWAEYINAYRAEALQTLRAEGVTVESVFLESTPDGDFLVYYMRASSLAKAYEIVESSAAGIDAYHQQFKKDTWAQVTRLETLVDLEDHAA